MNCGDKKTRYEEFSYQRELEVEVNLEDKKGEIAEKDYYIRIYENDNLITEERYIEIGENNKVENAVKKFKNLKEGTTCRIELLVKIRDRYYTLDYYEIDVKEEDEIKAISNKEEFKEIQPYGHYVVVNDLDFTGATGNENNYISWEGILDFNGHTVIRDSLNSSEPLFLKIAQEGIIENLVLEIRLNNEVEKSFRGLFGDNYGIVRNIQVNLTESNSQANSYVRLIGYCVKISGIVENFVINLEEPIYGANYISLVCEYNNGTIQNGYVYGKNIEAIYNIVEGVIREVGVIALNNNRTGVIQNVYSLVSVNTQNQTTSTERVGNILAKNNDNSAVKNVYSVGIGNIQNFQNGPNIAYVGSEQIENCYYFCDEIFNNKYHKKTTMLALRDSYFQNQILNSMGKFNVDELVEQGYYPQIIMPEVMPRQEYIELPEVKDSDLADILSTEVLEQNAEDITIRCNVHNPSGENIEEIKIENLTSSIISQEYVDGVSKVVLKLTNPTKYVSAYSIMSITTKGAFGTTYTRDFEENERILYVELYRPIYNVSDWKKIKQSPTENYMIMEDIDFINEGNDITINTKYTGKINGNGHTIKNININTYLFSNFNGQLVNLNINNITIKSENYYLGVLGCCESMKINNVHLSEVTLQNTKNTNFEAGALVARSIKGEIQDCSVRNLSVEMSEGKTIILGGITGYANSSNVENCYVSNIDFKVDKFDVSNGIGGIIGKAEYNCIIKNCYAEGKIESSQIRVGGIIGMQRQSFLSNCYSGVDIESDTYYIGGIVGQDIPYDDTNTIEDNISIGAIYSKTNSEYIGRIAGTTQEATNYAYSEQKINGLKTEEAYDAILLTKAQLENKTTYESLLNWQDSYDYSDVSQGVLPKLYYKDSKELLPYQEDIYIEKSKNLSVEEIEIEKEPTQITGRLVVNNEKELPILKLKIEDMENEITKQIHENGKTYISFKATPTRYYDSYKICELEYEEEGQKKQEEVNVKIDAIFYKEIYNFEDWQAIEIGTYQNYRLMQDIDFSGKNNIKTGVTIGRLEAEGEKKSLKNINITLTSGYTGLIYNMQNNMKNITFENIVINLNINYSSDNVGLISYSTSNYENVEFKNIEVYAETINHVGIIARINSGEIQNITLTDIKVKGRTYVGGLVGYCEVGKIENIDAKNLEIEASLDYAGGIIGSQEYYMDETKNINADNVTVIGQNYVGGIMGRGICGYITITNSNISGKQYVGGILGLRYSTSSVVNNSYLISKDNIIKGSSKYIRRHCWI